MNKFTIKQIIPAPQNLFAIFTDGDKPIRVLCLALWADADGEPHVSGMIPTGYEDLIFAEEAENFYVLEIREDGR